MKLRLIAVTNALLALSALSACSGSPSDADAPPPVAAREVPASAFADVAAYTGFAAQMKPTDGEEPLAVGNTEAPKTETGEPTPLS